MKSIPVFLLLITLVWCDSAAANYQSAKSPYERGDYETASAEFRSLAGQDDPRGQFALGLMYQKGWWVDQDHGEVLRWYQMAAEQGVARAQNNLGVLYRRGLAVERDFERALAWFRAAAARGFARAFRARREAVAAGEEEPDALPQLAALAEILRSREAASTPLARSDRD